MTVPEAGSVRRFERAFTREEVRAFVELSRDEGSHHVEPDEDGRFLVHGLLTATMPTKIGGEDDVLASEMTFRFHRPVYTGERLACTVEYDAVERRDDGEHVVTASVEVTRLADDAVVLEGSYEGVVRTAGSRDR